MSARYLTWARAGGALLLVAVVAAVALAVWNGWRARSAGDPLAMPGGAAGELAMTGLAYEEFEGGRRRFTLRAASLDKQPRKLGPLNVNPLKELSLTDATIELASTGPDEPFPDALVQAIRRTLDARDLRGVTRLRIAGLRVTELLDDRPALTLEARSATFGLEQRGLTMSQLTLTSPLHHQRLVAREASWQSDPGLLRVHGPHLFDRSNETSADARACFRVGANRTIEREEC